MMAPTNTSYRGSAATEARLPPRQEPTSMTFSSAVVDRTLLVKTLRYRSE